MPALLPSELPVRCEAHQHWIVLFTPPHKWWLVAFAVAVVVAYFDPNPFAWALGLVVALVAFFRWRTWRAERVILTGKRIIRLQGIPETTTTETSLRIDRVSGARIVETVPGKLLGYGTIELEAPGEHPGVRKLRRICEPNEFYLEIRSVIFGESGRPGFDGRGTDDFGDPDGPVRGSGPGRPGYGTPDHPTRRYGPPSISDTSPLPRVPPRRDAPRRDRFGRRQDWT